MKRFGLTLAFFIGVCFSTVTGAEDKDFSKGLLDHAALIKSGKEVTAKVYPNADDVLVDDHIWISYKTDGTSVTWDDTCTKILTEKGKRENQTLSFYYTLPYSTVEAKLLQVIKPDGKVIPVDVKTQSRVMVNRSQMGSNIYNPNSKILQIGIPGLEIGDMVRYVSLRREVKTRMPNTWSDYTVLEWNSPIKHFLYEIWGPKELPLKHTRLNNEIKGTVAFASGEKDGLMHYRWEARNVKRMYDEPAMPPRYTVVQHLIASTIPDWKTVSKWYWNLSKPHLETTTPEMKKKVAELTKGITNENKKIEAIFKWVSQEIRYLGITVEKEAPGYEPHPVKMTFEQKHGVCRDKAALLVAMLRLAGFKAYPVLIHNGPKKDEQAPTPYFNHAISCVENKDGEYILMDSTDENTKRIFPAYLCNQSYLVAKPEGETLKTSPIIPASENLMRISTTAKIDSAGDLSAKSVLRFEGINDNAYRGFFSRRKPEERRRYFEGVVKRVMAGAKLTEFTIEPANVMDTSRDLTVKLSFEAQDVLVSDGKTAMLPLPQMGTSVGMVNFVLGKTGLEKRKYPLVTELACGVRESVELDMDDSVANVLSMPKYAPIENEALGWSSELSYEKGQIRCNSEFLLKVVEFTPKQYQILKNTLKDIEFNQRKMPVFALRNAKESNGDCAMDKGSDAVIIAEKVAYDLRDQHQWTVTRTVKKKILSYAGKKKYSELKISYNPVWEDVSLEEGKVTSPDGKQTKEIQEKEINIMDAGWVGSAPRYPAGKTLVASLPGVEVGSIIETRIKRTCRDRQFFSMLERFQTFEPIRKKTVRVIAPRSLRINSDRMNGNEISYSFRVIHGGMEYKWEAKNMHAIQREDYLPPLWSFAPSLFCHTGSWRYYSRKIRNKLQRATLRQPKTRGTTLELIAKSSGRDERIRIIRDYVARNIRHCGPAINEIPLSKIFPADKTLADGYGNNSDRAALLHAMLSEAGLRPGWAIYLNAPRTHKHLEKISDMPSSDWLGGVFVYVKDASGKIIFLNDTDQYDIPGATAHKGYPALDLDSGTLFNINTDNAFSEKSDTTYTIELQENGDAKISRTRRIYGTEYGSFSKRFAEMPPEERSRYHQELIASISQAAVKDGELITDYTKYPAVEKFSVKVSRFAVTDGNYYYFKLPDSLAGLLRIRSDSRENPMLLNSQKTENITFEVRLPKLFRKLQLTPPKIELGEKLPDGISIHTDSNFDRKQGILGIKMTASLSPTVFTPESYPTILDINRKLAHPQARVVLLNKKASEH